MPFGFVFGEAQNGVCARPWSVRSHLSALLSLPPLSLSLSSIASENVRPGCEYVRGCVGVFGSMSHRRESFFKRASCLEHNWGVC